MGANKTSFTKEDVAKRRKIGEPHQGKGQMVCACESKTPVKSRNGKIYMHQKRISYAKWLMEKHLGRTITEHEVVYHIDGNPYNNDLSNLEIITRAELAVRNHKKRI